MPITPTKVKVLAEHCIRNIIIDSENKEFDFSNVNEKNINNEKFVFIPKNEQNNEKYGTYLYYSNTNGIWMGQFSKLNNKPFLKKPKLVMNKNTMSQFTQKEKLIPGFDYNSNVTSKSSAKDLGEIHEVNE